MTQLESQWLIEGKLLLLTQTGPQPVEEATAIFEWMITELDKHATSHCHALFLPVQLEPQYSAFTARKVSQKFFEHPKLGWVVQIEPNLSIIIHIMVRAAIQVAKTRYRHFKKLEEGIAFLQDIDPELPPQIVVPDLTCRPFEEWIKDKRG